MKKSLKGMLLVMSMMALVGCGDKTTPQNTPTPSERLDNTPTQIEEVTQPIEETIPELEENNFITKEITDITPYNICYTL